MSKITICACASRPITDKDRLAEIAVALRKRGCAVRVVADLCRLAMQQSPEIKAVAESDFIMACHSRAVRSLFDWVGVASAAKLINLREDNDAEIIATFNLPEAEEADRAGKDAILELMAGEEVDAWYPVIDKNRCTECGRCNNFCLVGVYQSTDTRIRVSNPQSCNYNCPACARMCPSQAIIFPKYGKSPINGGLTDEETFNPAEKDKLYHERLRMRLEQRKTGIPSTKNNPK